MLKLATITNTQHHIYKSKKIDENFHEIKINNQIYYATNDGKYLIVGNVIDLDTKESITENTKMKQRIAVIESIDTNNMIIYNPQKSNHIMTVLQNVYSMSRRFSAFCTVFFTVSSRWANLSSPSLTLRFHSINCLNAGDF